ncbi:hypothetical protein ACVWXM_007126 [Bradyrhizobium sp. GM7.3]
MFDRRILLTTVAGLFGLAAFRWLRASPAEAGEKAAQKFEIEKTDAEWRAQLTPQQYEILRKEGTERPGSSPLLKEHRKGVFACAGVRPAAVRLRHQIRERHGLAELLPADRGQCRQDRGPHLRHAPHRGALPALRRPSRPRLRRRSEADRIALLHRRFRAGLSSRGGVRNLAFVPAIVAGPGNCAPVIRPGLFR